MRAVVQRVASASVTVDEQVISKISRGLMVLVGIGTDDTAADIESLSNKILSLRVFSDASDAMWKASVKDIGGEVLCVSQFTLMANTSKGNKPDFHRAMGTEASRQLYSVFLEKMRQLYVPDRIQDGQFGAMMNVSLTNEGPVTFTLDTRKFEYITSASTSSTSIDKVKKPVKPASKAPPISQKSEPIVPSEGP
ncbi:D-Tyr tRNAtyr deacylase-like domain-containing protein [Hygrophoropsis aurantiaca]|uniref:D-Tyr tRNAtyr deacylase-like domain-containing protein n=1 Tax=Hygrophoropsis aurantiaca TaxID=72124 RepID=A0ACB8AMT3_9AGAM|nr:D-Tyr tRNAtyr deacylase-like domain-containing protein [Hygrophoropsis aurantiaca]